MSRSKRSARPCTQLRVLERVRVGVDADHARRRAPEHGGAVALATREVDHAAAVHALRDPLVDDEVAPEPVVLLRHVGQRALAREMEGRDARRLVALHVEVGQAEHVTGDGGGESRGAFAMRGKRLRRHRASVRSGIRMRGLPRSGRGDGP